MRDVTNWRGIYHRLHHIKSTLRMPGGLTLIYYNFLSFHGWAGGCTDPTGPSAGRQRSRNLNMLPSDWEAAYSLTNCATGIHPYQYVYNMNFSKNQISCYISTIWGSRAPKFRRMIDYLMDCVNNLIRTLECWKSFTFDVRAVKRSRNEPFWPGDYMPHCAKLPWQQ
jgi:hypothetical protein